MSTTRRQFLATLGTAVVAVPLAAVLPGKTPVLPTPTTPKTAPRKVFSTEWHVRYAQSCPGHLYPALWHENNRSLRLFSGGENEHALVVTSRFGICPEYPFCHDHFVYTKRSIVGDGVLYHGATWIAEELVYDDGCKVWKEKKIKIPGALKVITVDWSKSPNESMKEIKHIVSWQNPGPGTINALQAERYSLIHS